MARQQALIVDDEADIRELLQITLSTMGLDCDQAGSVKEGRKLLAKGNYDLCLTDMRLPDGQGIELVKEIQTNHPKTPVAVITAYGSMESAVETLKAGAFDYVSKPVDLKALRDLVNSALRLREDRDVRERRSRHTMIGDSSPMRRLRGLSKSSLAAKHRSSSTANPAPAKSWRRDSSTTKAQGRSRVSLPSTVEPYLPT